jgi:hypothetical protein
MRDGYPDTGKLNTTLDWVRAYVHLLDKVGDLQNKVLDLQSSYICALEREKKLLKRLNEVEREKT